MNPAGSKGKIDLERLPSHIAIIMDGNGRWARQKMRPRIYGHHAGVKTVDRVVTYCRKLGIKALTLYSFSSENWSRPPDEVSALMGILHEYLIRELNRMVAEDIRFNTIGSIELLPDFARNAISDVKKKTEGNTGMTLTLALSYGGRDEILRATQKLAQAACRGEIDPSAIDESVFAKALDTSGLPDPDLLIRTSGELRISNFLLWQLAYAEMSFTERLWPDFGEADIEEAILSYQNRERRFGKTTDQIRTE